LPYGEKVKVDYSENNTPEQALQEVMRIAIKNGCAEPLAWHGESNPTPGLCCLPKIYENGSTSVMGSIGKVDSVFTDGNGERYELISLINKSIYFSSFSMPHYTIHQINQNTCKLESGFEIEGGLYRKEVIVKHRDTEKKIKISLLGTRDTLELVREDNILVILWKE